MILDFNKQQLKYLSVNLLFICIELFEVQKVTDKFLEGRRFFSQLQYPAIKKSLISKLGKNLRRTRRKIQTTKI